MVKTSAMCSIDEDLKREAKEKGLVLSHILETALKKELNPENEMERLQCKKKDLLRRVEEVDKEINDLDTQIINGEFIEVDDTGLIDKAVKFCVEGYQRLGQVPQRTIEQQAKIAGINKSELTKLMFKELNKIEES